MVSRRAESEVQAVAGGEGGEARVEEKARYLYVSTYLVPYLCQLVLTAILWVQRQQQRPFNGL